MINVRRALPLLPPPTTSTCCLLTQLSSEFTQELLGGRQSVGQTANITKLVQN